MILTNEGQSDVKFSELEIWSNFRIDAVDADGNKKEKALLLIVPATKEVYAQMQNTIITVSPGSASVTTYPFGIVDSRVFDRPQSYEIRSSVFYDKGLKALRSNFVTVEVVDCKKS